MNIALNQTGNKIFCIAKKYHGADSSIMIVDKVCVENLKVIFIYNSNPLCSITMDWTSIFNYPNLRNCSTIL